MLLIDVVVVSVQLVCNYYVDYLYIGNVLPSYLAACNSELMMRNYALWDIKIN